MNLESNEFKWNNSTKSQVRSLTLDDFRKKFNEATSAVKQEHKEAEFLKCVLCDHDFVHQEESQNKQYLSHLLVEHKLVIADASLIGDFKSYVIYWREKLKGRSLDDFCFKITTNSLASDKGNQEDFYLLSDSLQEEKNLRESLQKYKLEQALVQQQKERENQSCFRECFFCASKIGSNRTQVLNHLLYEHNFNIGLADNIVYFDEFYDKLKARFESLKCFYCEKVFYDTHVLKEHMRKKQHKCINAGNKEFDKYYIINYLEFGKNWSDIKSENDYEMDINPSIDDWNDIIHTFCCLFCDKSYEREYDIVEHMTCMHHFNLKHSLRDLSFYDQVKFINYTRHMVYSNRCFVCKEQFPSNAELIWHLSDRTHSSQMPKYEYFNQPEYLFSTFEDDDLLCLLDDSSYSKDEEKIQVFPELYNLRIDDDLIKNFNEIL